MLQGQWNQIRGELKKKWGQLTEDDLRFKNGNIDQLIGRIQEKTGDGREAIEHFLTELTSQGASAISQAAETVGQYARQDSERFREQFADPAHEGYGTAGDLVRHNPAPVAVAAGVGFAAGLLVASNPKAAAKVALGTAAAATVGFALKDTAIITSLGEALKDVVAKVRGEWGLSRKDFGRLIGYSERVIADWERGKTISEPALRRVIEVARLHRALVQALAGIVQPGMLPRWLTTPNKAFGDSMPLQVIERGEVDRIWNMVYELESGMPS